MTWRTWASTPTTTRCSKCWETGPLAIISRESHLEWGWELVTKVWGIPAKRIFATVYFPDKSKGDPSDFDQEASDIWTGIFKKAGLDPKVHIVHGGKKDNFWMMGETGPCGPCSEINVNLGVSDDEAAGRALVNAGSPRCIEIWNHVFIQFNANADGTFSPLAAKHVDTGMGFERVCGIRATTRGFTDFSAEPSNYDSDVFAPLFARIAALSGRTYKATVPKGRTGLTDQEQTDVAFRVLADHARCVSCAIADGILPGNESRNYVIRRILRRASSLRPKYRTHHRLLRTRKTCRPRPRILGRRLSRAQAAGVDAAPRHPLRGGKLRPDAGARPQALRRGRFPGEADRGGRLRALRHVRIPRGPDPGDRNGARTAGRCRGI